jgi:hypothetical protein
MQILKKTGVWSLKTGDLRILSADLISDLSFQPSNFRLRQGIPLTYPYNIPAQETAPAAALRSLHGCNLWLQ